MRDSPAAVLCTSNADLLNTTEEQDGTYTLTTRPRFDAPLRDAFGRVRVSSPVTLFDSQLQYSSDTAQWAESVSGASSALTHDANSSTLLLTCGTESTAYAIRQTRRFFRYRSGKSHLVFCTGTLGTGTANSVRRIGYFDDKDGVFFELDGTTLNVVLRSSSATGAAQHTRVAQSSFSEDKIDGTGLSGFTIDPSKANIYFFDIEWLGVGLVRTGVVSPGGELIYTHYFENANANEKTYMRTANLPVRYEIRNTAAQGSTTTMRQICASVITEGGQQEPEGCLRSITVDPASLPTATTTLRSMLAIRPTTSVGGQTNRAQIQLALGEVALAESGIAYYEVLRNPTDTINGWTAHPSSSAVEYSRDNVAITTGTVIDSGFVTATKQALGTQNLALNAEEYLTRDIAGSDPTTIVLAVRTISGTANTLAALRWKETL